jgi:hypothetical protein
MPWVELLFLLSSLVWAFRHSQGSMYSVFGSPITCRTHSTVLYYIYLPWLKKTKCSPCRNNYICSTKYVPILWLDDVQKDKQFFSLKQLNNIGQCYYICIYLLITIYKWQHWCPHVRKDPRVRTLAPVAMLAPAPTPHIGGARPHHSPTFPCFSRPSTYAAPLPSMYGAQQLQQTVAASGSYCNMHNTPIYFWNIQIKQLQHTYETAETFETCIW